jgi:Holliday junction resolvase RusA-like endonuclease
MMNEYAAKAIWDEYARTRCFPVPRQTLLNERYYGKVYSKGRPRFGGGHAFTPKNTREFEASVADWMSGLGIGNITCPVSVEILLYDRMAQKISEWRLILMETGVLTSTVGDLDNRAKSILDSMNGEIIMDDKQINRLKVTRNYSRDEGFHLTVKANGYSPSEIDMLGMAYYAK